MVTAHHPPAARLLAMPPFVEEWGLSDGYGAIAESEPPALRRLGFDPDHWTGQVKGIGSAYWRIVGTAEAIMAKAKEIEQEWMKGIGYARWLERFL